MALPFLIFLLAAAPKELPVAPPPRPAAPTNVDPSLADWTPRPATGLAEPWEKATDKDWIDPRFRTMNTGPAFNCTMRYPLSRGNETVYKATTVKFGEKGDGGAVFDRCTMRLCAAWTGGFLNHSDRRFALLNTPTPKGEMVFASPVAPGWADPAGEWDPKVKTFTAPLPKEWAKYRGHYVCGDRVVFSYTVNGRPVLETATSERLGKFPVIARTVEVLPGKGEIWWEHCPDRSKPLEGKVANKKGIIAWFTPTAVKTRVGYTYAFPPQSELSAHALDGFFGYSFRKSEKTERFKAVYTTVTAGKEAEFVSAAETVTLPEDLSKLTKGGPKRWGEPIVTKLVRGSDEGPFAVDTLTIPYTNRFNALFFCTGLDFLPDGRIAVCTCHGDVWLVTVNEKATTCTWQRFATGLYHPLGLKIVGGKVVVLERGQLTRLHDLNDDGEADFYECLNNDWHTGGGEHSYDTCLETDPQGNFYFFKTGDTNTPTGGCLLKVSKDGTKSEIFCTGFRHPIGLGISPTGIITGADQEGNWMPATRIDQYKKGGFYGDMRAHHRATPPTTYDPPLCWLPREVDNSAGGQVWVPKDAKGWEALAGLPLHFSYGRCNAFVLLRQELADDRVQGGASPLGVKFLSGVCRGRFHPDGNLYVCGLNGWQTAAQADGCVQRVRPTGKALSLPVAMEVKGKTIRITFSQPLDAKSVQNTDHYRAAWWNYLWSGEYGSKRWKVSNPKMEGQDDVPVRGAKLLPDGRTVEVTFDELRPVMQMMVGYNVKAADGKPVVGSVHLTIHATE